jgi:hypothetical protein
MRQDPLRMTKRYLIRLIILSVLLSFSACQCSKNSSSTVSWKAIPVEGNSWVTNDLFLNEKMITDSGIVNWTDTSTIIQSYFYTEGLKEVQLGILARIASGTSKLVCRLGGKIKTIRLSNTQWDTIPIGTFPITSDGYQRFQLKGLKKSGKDFAEVTDILVGIPADDGKIVYVKDDFYWGRRGPSVHLRYEVPKEAEDIRWFYNEITVPEGNDVLGSCFMACGFADGYFGFQVNSPEERRILFSVWSPYETDNPSDIPEEDRIILLKKGENVYTGEFGNEGSGGQSYLKYNWKAWTTYRFLLKGQPSANHSTDFTAWFYAPELDRWLLIACFRRPKTGHSVEDLYAFLENFWTETGFITRMAWYSNPWVCDPHGRWYAITKATFTADATARKGARLDYAGGVENGSFCLKNCGFFSERTEIHSVFTIDPSSVAPEIDFRALGK